MPDDKQTLSLATLHQLDDGMVGRVVDAELQKVLRDCEDRPSLDKVRKVTIQLEITPLQDDRSYSLRGIDTQVQVKAFVPPTGTRKEFLYTSHDSSKKTVNAALPDSHQDNLFDSQNEEAN